jgi:hypothetical protein
MDNRSINREAPTQNQIMAKSSTARSRDDFEAKLVSMPLSASLVDNDTAPARKKARLAAVTSDDSAAMALKRSRKGKERATSLKPVHDEDQQMIDTDVDQHGQAQTVQQPSTTPVRAPHLYGHCYRLSSLSPLFSFHTYI